MKPVDIAMLNERITFQKNTASVDRFGNHTNSWDDRFSCFCHVDTWQKEESGNEVIEDRVSITFECRYCPELEDITSTGYRIMFRGHAYNIISVDLMNYDKRTIRFKAEKELRYS